ncbi:MATE family efflux transporter [Parasalinivibrio latis]|uniref:MATE family efflux transporter n=1 Tax=Parasalinivibrio latis TaxID=2952610 RepID=UPI0030DEB5A6
MTWPMIFGVLSLMSFQLVDSAFIGRLGIEPLAAQGFTMPIQMMVIGLQVGLGIATTALISRVLGKGNVKEASQIGGLVVLTGAASVFALCLLVWFGRDPILLFLGAHENLFPIIDSYWKVWLGSAWLGAMLYFAYSLCRSHGNTMLPGILMVVTSLLNMGLDPLFMFTFGMGLNGAAWATIAAFGFGILVVFPLVVGRNWLSFNWNGLEIRKSLGDLGKIMAPAMVSQMLPPLASTLATKLVAGFGSAAVAAWALGSRVEFFAIVVVLALTMSMPPMIARMYGAGDRRGVTTTLSLAMKFVFVWQLLIGGLIWLMSSQLSNLLANDSQVIQILHVHLMWVPLSLSLLGICILLVSACNALGMPIRGLIISILRLFACFLPLVWLGANTVGLNGIFIGAAVGNIMAGVVAYKMYRMGYAETKTE